MTHRCSFHLTAVANGASLSNEEQISWQVVVSGTENGRPTGKCKGVTGLGAGGTVDADAGAEFGASFRSFFTRSVTQFIFGRSQNVRFILRAWNAKRGRGGIGWRPEHICNLNDPRRNAAYGGDFRPRGNRAIARLSHKCCRILITAC